VNSKVLEVFHRGCIDDPFSLHSVVAEVLNGGGGSFSIPFVHPAVRWVNGQLLFFFVFLCSFVQKRAEGAKPCFRGSLHFCHLYYGYSANQIAKKSGLARLRSMVALSVKKTNEIYVNTTQSPLKSEAGVAARCTQQFSSPWQHFTHNQRSQGQATRSSLTTTAPALATLLFISRYLCLCHLPIRLRFATYTNRLIKR
jgi:hypothetical protein